MSCHVLAGTMENRTSKLVATGVPPNVYLLHELESVKLTMKELHADIVSRLDEIPRSIQSEVQRQVHTSSFGVLSVAHLNESLQKLERSLLNVLAGITQPVLSGDSIDKPDSNEHNLSVDEIENDWIAGFGNVRCPPGKLFDVWNLWWDGSQSHKIPPLRTCLSRDFESRSDKGNFAKVKAVIGAVVFYSKRSNSEIIALNKADRVVLFKEAVVAMGKSLAARDDSSKPQKLAASSYHTVYDLIVKSRKQ
ncbi:hypothetical protein AC1031_020412 [Aphanomyces cochlioides]|nr:hypothetical protein AC1031_020412 [Aphanomyces cochlioides]